MYAQPKSHHDAEHPHQGPQHVARARHDEAEQGVEVAAIQPMGDPLEQLELALCRIAASVAGKGRCWNDLA